MKKNNPVAVLLLAFGGPNSIEEIEPFLENIFSGKKPSPEQLEKIKERYRLIGGGSPLNRITFGQAEALEKSLREKGINVKVYTGMRYWYPLIKDTLEEMVGSGVKNTIALSLAPHASYASTGAYKKAVKDAKDKVGGSISIFFAKEWHTHPLFLEALGEKIKEAIFLFSEEERKKLQIIYSVHSLPLKFLQNDPYVDMANETIAALAKIIGPYPWHLGFQSRGQGDEAWLEPDVFTVLKKLSMQGGKEVLMVPLGFVSDHVETLYDIDILCFQEASRLGLNFKRSSSLNDSGKFVRALTAIVVEELKSIKS